MSRVICVKTRTHTLHPNPKTCFSN